MATNYTLMTEIREKLNKTRMRVVRVCASASVLMRQNVESSVLLCNVRPKFNVVSKVLQRTLFFFFFLNLYTLYCEIMFFFSVALNE